MSAILTQSDLGYNNNLTLPSVPSPETIEALNMGFELFPLERGTKTGYFYTAYKDGGSGYSWQRQATKDLKQVMQWGSEYPGCNWAGRTGETSGIDVFDTDSPEALQYLVDQGLEIIHLVKTGHRDGNRFQVYVRHPQGKRIKTASDILNGAPAGLDIRGDKNGYVLLPPSIHPHGNPYVILRKGELPEIPQSLLDLVIDNRVEPPTVDISDLPELTPDQKQLGINTFLKRCRLYKEYIESTDPEWNNENDELNKLAGAAGKRIARGVFEEDWAIAQIEEAGTVYAAREKKAFKATLKSGLGFGKSRPWDPAEIEEYLQEQGELNAATIFGASPDSASLPPGASLTPLPNNLALNPQERMIANLATQHAIALIFEKRMTGKMLYDHTRKSWMEYDGTRWRLDERKRVHNFILSIASEMNSQNKASMVQASFCNGVNTHLQSFPTFSRTSKDFDQDHYLLNTPSGTIDLRTGKMRPHDPNDMITLCTAAAPDAECEGTAFQKFMIEITGGDQELIRFHQVSLGACLSGAVEGHWLLFWYGVPRAGKNTFGDLVEGSMGDYARTIPTSTLMSKKFESHPTEMANLQGIRLATSSELSDGDHWNEARVKQLTGDATISARWIGGNFFEFDRTFKLLVYGNHKPQLRSADEALRARLKIVPFKHSFLGREDPDLPARLWAEQGYVLQWLIEGHQMWLEAGKKLPVCAAVESEIAEYFEGQSTPKLWLKECCEILADDHRPDLQLHTVVECYRSYKNWKDARGESALSQTRWEPEALTGLQVVRTRKGKCVRKLKLLPIELSYPLTSVPTPLPTVPPAPAPVPVVDTFAEFVARMNRESPVN